MKLFLPIQKVDVEKRQVWGRATQEVADRAKEIFDYESSVPFFKDWSENFAKATASLEEPSLGNIRAMHQKVAAGKVIDLQFNDAEKAIDIGTEIVDDNEWEKVKKGVYTGFSIGGGYVKKWADADNATLTRFTAKPSEISLVDYPCVPTATFAMVKAAGVTETVPFQRYGVLSALLEKGDLSIGDVCELSKAYLPDDEITTLAKADATIGSMIDRLRELVAVAPAETVQKDASATTTETAAPAAAAPADAKQMSESAAPAPVKKAFKVLRLEKGMYSVRSFADILQTTADLAMDAESEKQWEGDASTVPADLRAWLQMGIELFKKMSAEEADELIASVLPPGEVIEIVEAAAPTGDLAKAGKRHSAKDQEMIQAVHDHAAALGADCGGSSEKVAKSAASEPTGLVLELGAGEALSELGKAVQLVTGAAPSTTAATAEQITALAKHALSLADANDTLQKRVEWLEKQPAMPKGKVRTFDKTDDSDDVKKVDAAIAPDPKNPIAVMKAVHDAGGTRVQL